MPALEIHLDRLPKSVELVRDGNGAVFCYIDERQLPEKLIIEQTRDWRDVVDAVKDLAVRGAMAIGLAGASALALWAFESVESHAAPSGADELEAVAYEIATARPTAVNLQWAVNRACDAVRDVQPADRASVLFELVQTMQKEDEASNRSVGDNGAELLEPGSRVLTHCNAGSLAAYFYGTALGVIYSAAGQGKISRVYADETRPVGQGARLTAWELARVGVPVTLICDDMAASLMAQGEVDAVVVGADRIARNGDTANKIGTYGLAVLAHEHNIPFYVAAPTSTIDADLEDGSGIVIEQRAASEVLPEPIEGVDVWNPAFDVTPARFITKIVTEQGVFDPGEITRVSQFRRSSPVQRNGA